MGAVLCGMISEAGSHLSGVQLTAHLATSIGPAPDLPLLLPSLPFPSLCFSCHFSVPQKSVFVACATHCASAFLFPVSGPTMILFGYFFLAF